MLTSVECGFSPDLEDLPRLFFGIWGGSDDEQAIQEVDGDAVRTLVVCAADTGRLKSGDVNIFTVAYQIATL